MGKGLAQRGLGEQASTIFFLELGESVMKLANIVRNEPKNNMVGALLIFGMLSCQCASGEWLCGHDGNDLTFSSIQSMLDGRTGPLRAKVIFVNFLGDSIPVTSISWENKANMDSLCCFINNISTSKIQMTWELIGVPGDTTESEPWGVPGATTSYRKELDPDHPWFEESSHWWANQGGTLGGGMLGQVLYNIKNEYFSIGASNPFVGTDFLIVNYLYENSNNGYISPLWSDPLRWIDGYARISLLAYEAYPDSVDGYFESLSADVRKNIIGIQCVVKEDVLTSRTILAHELGHIMGFGHSQGYNSGSDWKDWYGYGLLDVMTAGYSREKGFQTYSLYGLTDVGNPNHPNWYPVEDFTGRNLYSEVLYDIRNAKGKTYQFILPDVGGYPQYFLFAYHGDNPVDITQDPTISGDVLRGLEIQHCFGGKYCDLESGYGRYSDPSPFEFVEDGYWNNVDEETGYDNHDSWEGRYWKTENGYLGQQDYQGHEDDFFKLSGNPVFGFSEDCNPNSHGLDPSSAEPWRRIPNNQWNSLYVEIKEEYDDSLVVDLLSAPYESIRLSSGEDYGFGDLVEVRHSVTTKWEPYLTTYEVFFCPNQSGFPLLPVMEGNYNPNNPLFSFTIKEDFGTQEDGGMVVFKLHNNKSGFTGDFTAGPLHVSLDPVVFERVLLPSDGAQWVVGCDERIEWSATFNHDMVSQIRVMLATGQGKIEAAIFDEFNTDWFVDESSGNYFGVVPVVESMKTDAGILYLEINGKTPPDIAAAGAVDLVILPPLVSLNDISTTAIQSGGYSEPPISVVPIAGELGNPNFGKSLILSLKEGEGQDAGAFYQQSSAAPGIGFENWGNFNFPDGQLFTDSRAIAVADFDGDGDEDFFACGAGHGESALFVRQGNKFLKTTLGSPGEIDNPKCANWVDYDHDGDLDLFVGQGADGADILPNLLFENGMTGFHVVPNVGGMINPGNPIYRNTIAVLWADLDFDGYWEVLVGNADNRSRTSLFEEVPGGGFAENRSHPFGPLLVTSIVAQDFNNDTWVDLVLGLQDGPPVVFLNSSSGFDSANSFTLPLQYTPHQIAEGDVDGDGWIDLLITSGLQDQSFTLWKNFMGYDEYSQEFIEISDCLPSNGEWGIPSFGGSLGAVQSDFDLDGDLDLFVGVSHGASGGAVWENGTTEGDWLGIRLQPLFGVSPVGSTVLLFDGNGLSLGSRLFGCSGGRGAQGSNDIIFGLDEYLLPLSVVVLWPWGDKSTVEISDTSSLNGYKDICGDILWDFHSVSPKCDVVVSPNQMDLMFTWEVVHWSSPESDWVEFVPQQNCRTLGSKNLIPGVTPGVSVSLDYSIDPNSSNPIYKHTLIYEDVECTPGCTFQFTIHSGNTGSDSRKLGPVSGRFPKLCPIATGN